MQVLREAGRNRPWCVLFCGVRGFPLGEHGRVGGIDRRLFAEQLHVPMMWRFPDGTGRLARSGELASHCDVVPTIMSWVDGDDDGGADKAISGFDGLNLIPQIARSDRLERAALVAAGSSGSLALRTSEWCLRFDPPATGDAETSTTDRGDWEADGCALYVRPDDRWEANDVAQLCPELVVELKKRLERAATDLRSGEICPSALRC